MMRLWVLAVVALAAILVCTDATPLPGHAQAVVVRQSDVAHLAQRDAAVVQSAKLLQQSLRKAESFGGPVDLGDTRETEDQARVHYERALHGDLKAHQQHEAEAGKSMVRAELKALRGGTTALQVAAEHRLRRDKQIGDAAMEMAVSTEIRRERKRRPQLRQVRKRLQAAKDKSSTWDRQEYAAMAQVAQRSARAAVDQAKAIQSEQRTLAERHAPGDGTVAIPRKIASATLASAKAAQKHLAAIRAAAVHMEDALNPSHHDPLGDGAPDALSQQLQDAAAAKQVTLTAAHQALRTQRRKQRASIEGKLSRMRQRFGLERREAELHQVQSVERQEKHAVRTRIQKMTALSEQVQHSAFSAAAKFDSILKSFGLFIG